MHSASFSQSNRPKTESHEINIESANVQSGTITAAVPYTRIQMVIYSSTAFIRCSIFTRNGYSSKCAQTSVAEEKFLIAVVGAAVPLVTIFRKQNKSKTG